MNNNNLEIVLENQKIEKRISEIAKYLDDKYTDQNPIIIGIMRGAVYFLTSLTQKMHIPLEIELMGISSYGSAAETSGNVKITKDIELDIKNRPIIIVEDIIDTGTTLEYLKKYFLNLEVKSVETISLFIKEKSKNNEILPDEIGFYVPNEFLVGYGLDYANKYRNLPNVYKILDLSLEK